MKSTGRIFLLFIIGLYFTGCSGSSKMSRIYYIEEPVIIVDDNPPPRRPHPIPKPQPPIYIQKPVKEMDTTTKKYRETEEKVRSKQNESSTRERTGDRTLTRGRTR